MFVILVVFLFAVVGVFSEFVGHWGPEWVERWGGEIFSLVKIAKN